MMFGIGSVKTQDRLRMIYSINFFSGMTKQLTFDDMGMKTPKSSKPKPVRMNDCTGPTYRAQASLPKTELQKIRDMNRRGLIRNRRANRLAAFGLMYGATYVFYYKGHWYASGDMIHCGMFPILHNIARMKQICKRLNLQGLGKAYDDDLYYYKKIKAVREPEGPMRCWCMVCDYVSYGEKWFNCDDEYNLVPVTVRMHIAHD